MKKIKIILITCFIIVTHLNYGQSNYIGLNDIFKDYDVRKLNPKIQIIDDYIYIPTNSGIFRKNLAILNDTIWESFAFKDIPIRDFVKSGNKILAITPKSSDSLMLLSLDNGNSYINYTNSHFFEYENFNSLHRISQNKQNPNSIVVLQDHYGVSKSENFGFNWNNLNAWSGGYQEKSVEFHPNDSLSIYYTGETELFSSYTQTSNDGGLTWSISEFIQNNCTHHLAFNPLDQNSILAGQEGHISKSIDKGLTWLTPYALSEYLYIYKIIFDETNPDIIYATGALNGPNNSIIIYKSVDNGNSWTVSFQETLYDCGGVWDMVQYQNKLILLTLKKGVYMLETRNLSTEYFPFNDNFYIYPNPTTSTLYFSSLNEIKRIQITDFTGKLIKYFEPFSFKSNEMDISDIAKGIYFITFFTDKEKVTKKVTIK